MYGIDRDRLFDVLQIAALLAFQACCWAGIGVGFGYLLWGIR